MSVRRLGLGWCEPPSEAVDGDRWTCLDCGEQWACVEIGGDAYWVSEVFEPLPGSRTGKIRCKICGATGYDVDHVRSWQHAHRRGHSPCPRCGKMLTILMNGKPRTHTRCPK
jgi:ribosomal protein S27E